MHIVMCWVECRNGKLNTLPLTRLTLQQYQMVAWQPRMGDLNSRMGSAFCWASQVLYREDATQSS
jgi:hypothetical protein